MRRSIDVCLLLALTALVGCGPPSPETIELHTVEGSMNAGGQPASVMAEGDLMVVDATPRDGEAMMELCIDASSTATNVRVSRVRGQCRRFVVVASGAGPARVRFEARGTVSELVLDVTPVR